MDVRDVRVELDLLGAVWQRWGQVGATLDAQQWQAPTRCVGWDVAALYAHVGEGVGGLAALVQRRRVDGPPEHRDAVELLRALKPSEEVARALADKIADAAVVEARRVGPERLVRRLAEQGPQAIEVARRCPDATVEYFRRGTTTVAGAVTLRLVEASVHYLDLAAAVRDEGLSARDLPAGAWQRTARFLLAMTPTVDFIEVATGRRPATIFPVHA